MEVFTMKKSLLSLILLLLLSGPCLALYTLTGTVYYQGTTTAVPNAAVSLSAVGCTASTTADIYGGFTLQCAGDMSGKGITVTATAPAGFWSGQKTWTVRPNTASQYKKIYVLPTIQSGASLQLPSTSTSLLGTPGSAVELAATYQIQATGAPLMVQNAQINMVFNGPEMIINWIEPAAGVIITDVIPSAGGLNIEIEVDPPRNVPDFPAESFFDVFFEVEIPESGAELAKVTIQEAIFNFGTESGMPGVTDHLVGEHQPPSPYFLVDSETEWTEKLNTESPESYVRRMNEEEGIDYLLQLKDFFIEGEPYSPIDPDLPDFIPPELFIYPGGDDGQSSPVPDPDDAGLVMEWGDDNTPDGEKASAWKFDYGDPDLSNCIITVTATPPGPSGINRISLGMQDINGNIRSWWWNVPGVIPHNVPTTVIIDTTQTGLAATNPPASGFANNAAFDLTKVQSIVADENAAWVSGAGAPVPGGGQVAAIWNYWHNLSVTPKSPATGANSKWYVKYSQPPVVINEPEDPPLILGWDEVSDYANQPIMADDWKCEDKRPITDIHWWGSFKGWTQPHLPPIMPVAFRIGIWTDVPAGVDQPYSHPGVLLWDNICTTAVWNFAGYDQDPRCEDPQYPCEENEACFQWAQFLNQDEWFYQEGMQTLPDGTEVPNIYWLSIAAVYGPNVDYADPDFYPWGWKTREHYFMDDAIRITNASQWPPVVGDAWTGGDPVEFPPGVSWDLAFELTTNEPKCPGLIADLNEDCIVNLPDFAIMAQEWLLTSP